LGGRVSVQAKKKDKVTIEDNAADLALLIYEAYKAEKASGKIIKGQNNANRSIND
jgi:hypothetical protein